jgi:hypothetical protein
MITNIRKHVINNMKKAVWLDPNLPHRTVGAVASVVAVIAVPSLSLLVFIESIVIVFILILPICILALFSIE